ncbi:hypothetical protein Dda_3544 [Drechslerella dactyloides]|uniref:Uncharacterized protein n=1 Tax=Drechslerella dactyloides TaxID=74499 RepID=A0AAD6IY46_DREDA|nr:hypothetical protein Dda_3544 [Drechslerella dactyloides]
MLDAAIYPTSDYAEDQKLPHFILTTHVIHRGMPIGAFISSVIPLTSRYILRRPAAKMLPFSTMLLRSNSTGLLVTSGLMVAMTWGRMAGRPLIEWQDRSWRLLRNEGQCQLDDFSAAGGVTGAVVGLATRGSLPFWRGVVGGFGLGTLAGTAAFAAYKISSSGEKAD